MNAREEGRGGPGGLDPYVLQKVLAGLDHLDLLGRAADRGAPHVERLAAVAELVTRPEEEVVADLLTLAETDESLRQEILFALGRRGLDEAHQPLLDLLRLTREPWIAATAAEILERAFDDDTGVRRFQGDLGSIEEAAFQRAWRLYRGVVPRRRGSEYLERVGRALQRQTRPSHVAALLHLLHDVEPSPALGELVVPFLPDRRRVRVPVLGQRGQVGDFAAECLLVAVGVTRPRGLLGRLRYRRLRRRVQSRVRGVEDWQELVAQGPSRWEPSGGRTSAEDDL